MNIVTTMLRASSVPQKLMVGGLGLALVLAAAYNVAQAIEIRHLSKSNATLDRRINDPAGGYVVRLTQAEVNSASCTAAVARQGAAIRAQSAKDAATVAAVQGRYDREHAARLHAEKTATLLVAHGPKGASLAERVADVDAMVLGDLK